jgi:hypothetical protein
MPFIIRIMSIMGIPRIWCPPVIGISPRMPPEASGIDPIGLPCVVGAGVPDAAGGDAPVCASTPVAVPATTAAINRTIFREDIGHSI